MHATVSADNRTEKYMASENERVTVAISKETHTQHASIAKLLGLDLKDATEEAVREWNRKNAKAASAKAVQLLRPAA